MEQKPKPQNTVMQPIETVHIQGNIYLVKGGAGANTFFYTCRDSVIAIDAKMTDEAARNFLAEISKVTDKPVKTMIITHSDMDHVNGLAAFPGGMRIISHDKTRFDMRADFEKKGDQRLMDHLPTEIFVDSMTLDADGEQFRLIHFEPAHTGGDVIVHFVSSKIAVTGDLVTVGRDPLVHRHKGGSSYGLVRNLKALMHLDADLFLCGHNDPCTKKNVENLIESVSEKQRKIEELFRQKKTLDEVKAILKVEERPPTPSGMMFPTLEESIYEDLKGGRI